MYCSYHPTNAARVQCGSCARWLCAGCDHRIKGYPYCQDCIVLGVESLSQNYREAGRSKAKARLAALCALVPGLGAVYNRQNVKAVVHFITIVGLFTLSDMHVLEGLFALSGVVFYFYSIIDAYRTARAIAEGESPAVNEARFKRSLTSRAPMIGLILIAAGLIFIIQTMRPLGMFISLSRLLPIALIFLGGYLLTRYFRRSSGDEQPPDYSRRPPYSLIPGRAGETESQARSHTSHRGGYR
jgi:TM2 domain-containing membrane protein YozV